LRYQQAMDKALNGESNSALTLYLELAGEENKIADSTSPDALLPMDPNQAAAEILAGQGAFREAEELRKMQKNR
jgi:hypothetical protein